MADISGDHLFDIIIIGAGIMGSCAAYEASMIGKKIILLEQFDLLHRLGSSHGESRTIRATYAEPYYPPMVIESSRLWEAAQSAAGYRVITPTTHLNIGPAENPTLRSCILNCSPDSLPAKIFHAASTDPEEIPGAFLLPDGWLALSTPVGGIINPTKAVAMFHSLALHHGAIIRDRSVVENIERAGASIRVSTIDGRIFHGRKCVVTVGAWTQKLVKTVIGRELPIQPLHLVVWYWKIREGFEAAMSPAAGFPTFASDDVSEIFGTPSLEYPGLMKVMLDAGLPCDPDCRDFGIGSDVARVGQVAEWIERVMPGRFETAGGPVIKQACLYSMTPDHDYVIDFMGGEFGKDVVIAGGFSGHGFKMAPVVGRMIVEMVVEGEAASATRIGVDMGLFGMRRFDGNPKGNFKAYMDYDE